MNISWTSIIIIFESLDEFSFDIYKQPCLLIDTYLGERNACLLP